MRVLLFDPFSGASGDMIMACLLDLGADPCKVIEAVESVGCKIEISEVERGHIQARSASITSDRRFKSLKDARMILGEASLAPAALKTANRILETLASAEGRVHGVAPGDVRFHEVGSMDALADIAGCAAAIESFGPLHPDRILSLPVSAGSGTVETAHGKLPVPAPATMEILRSFEVPWSGGPEQIELLTPTGAAILASTVEQFVRFYPEIRAECVGYGAGSRDTGTANVLRGVIGQVSGHPGHDRVVQIETNLDDVTGEVIGNLIEVLMEHGALDVSVVPATMKKGRNGCLISLIAREDDIDEMSKTVMRETGSLGLRIFPLLHRIVAERESLSVPVAVGGGLMHVAVKVGRIDGEVFSLKPEFDDCQKVARKTGIPAREVSRMATVAGWELISRGQPPHRNDGRKID